MIAVDEISLEIERQRSTYPLWKYKGLVSNRAILGSGEGENVENSPIYSPNYDDVSAVSSPQPSPSCSQRSMLDDPYRPLNRMAEPLEEVVNRTMESLENVNVSYTDLGEGTPRHRGRSQKRSSFRDAVSEDARPPQKRVRLPTDATVSGLKDRVTAMVSSREVALNDLGALFFQHSVDPQTYEEIVVTINDVKIKLGEIQNLQKSVRNVPESSDAVVRLLTTLLKRSVDTMAGLGVLVDSLLRNITANRADITAAKSSMVRMSLPKLPDGAKLHYSNLYNSWVIPATPPFLQFDLNHLMESWEVPSRARDDDHMTHCADFVRRYLVKACSPPTEVQKYACRLTGKNAKVPSLLNLPDVVTNYLIGCLLEGLKLGVREIFADPEALAEKPTRYWLALGRDYESRKQELLRRKTARAGWAVKLRQSIGRALNDVRQYEIKHDELLPSGKRRKFSVDEEEVDY